MKKKAISPIITIVLLSLLVVILVSFVTIWGKEKVKQDLEKTEDAFNPVSDVVCLNSNLVIDSCKLFKNEREIEFVLTNPNAIVYFDFVLTLESLEENDKEERLVVKFKEPLHKGQTQLFKVNLNEKKSDVNLNKLILVSLTNGACRKEIINLLNLCEFV